MLTYWQRLNRSLGLSEDVANRLWQGVAEAYQQEGRHYHTISHLENMFQLFKEFEYDLNNKTSLFLAIVFHDFVYDTKRKDNENQSATVAKVQLTSGGYSKPDIEMCCQLINDTRLHQPSSATFDNAFFLDIDLAILAANEKNYQQYAANVRREYAWVSDSEYRRGRSKVLKSFLNRAEIFFTNELAERFTKKARHNLKSELKSLI